MDRRRDDRAAAGRPVSGARPPQIAQLMSDLTGGRAFSGEFENCHHDVCGRPIGMMGMSHDVTPRKQAEAERDRALAQLVRLYRGRGRVPRRPAQRGELPAEAVLARRARREGPRRSRAAAQWISCNAP
jgi:hypothetical protein